MKLENASLSKKYSDSVALISDIDNKDTELKECKSKSANYEELIKKYKIENVVLRYSAKNLSGNDVTPQIQNLRQSVAQCLIDAIDDMANIDLSDLQLDTVFKIIYERKLKDHPYGTTSVHIPSRQLKEIIVQTKTSSLASK